jgi:ERCC4-related helicase
VKENSTPTRHRLSNPAAEQIAASADRIEAQAAEVRPSDKRLAMKLLKEATRLRHCARALDIQHKRAVRVLLHRASSGRDAARADEALMNEPQRVGSSS